MAKRLNIIKHHSLEEIQKVLLKSNDFEFSYRLLVIEKILNFPDISSKEICSSLFISPNTFFKWLKWYNEGGIERLKDGDGGRGCNSGAEQKYSDKVFEALKDEINKKQDTVWTLEKMQYFIKDTFNIEPPTLQAIYYRIKNTHSYKSSRPYPYKADRDKLGQFKKKA